MSATEALRGHLVSLGTTSFGSRVHIDHVPESSDEPYVWVTRSGLENEVLLDGASNIIRSRYDVEFVNSDLNIIDVADTIRGQIHGLSGTLGTSDTTTVTCQGLFVEDHDEDYIPRTLGRDDGAEISTFQITLITTE